MYKGHYHKISPLIMTAMALAASSGLGLDLGPAYEPETSEPKKPTEANLSHLDKAVKKRERKARKLESQAASAHGIRPVRKSP